MGHRTIRGVRARARRYIVNDNNINKDETVEKQEYI